MTTPRQDKEFLSAVIGDSLLDEAIRWIKKNIPPEDVYNKETLEDWAYSNEFTKNL